MQSTGRLGQICSLALFTFGRMGVPIFLMISGYLLLDRKYDAASTEKFWKENWLHLLICTEIWFLIYEIFLMAYSGEKIGFNEIIGDLLFVHKVKLSHVWYMPMILGMYVLLPFAAKAIQSFESKYLYFPILLFCVYSFGFPTLKVINNGLDGEALSLQMSLGFSGGAYGLYLMLGYFVKKGIFKKIHSLILTAIAATFMVLTVALQLWSYDRGVAYNVWYDCAFLMIGSLAFFELLSRIENVPVYGLVKWLSNYAFAVYLIHNIFKTVFTKYILALGYPRPVKVVLLDILISVVSFACSWLIARIPRIGTFLIYAK